MKNTFTLLLFLLVIQLASAQKIRFTDSTNKWSVFNFGLSPSDPFFYQHWECSYTGDSTVNGISYKVSQFGLVREDTISNKVYIRFNHPDLLAYDTAERVLYYYNWQVGDTVVHTFPFKIFKRFVTAIDSTKVNGIWHRVWHFGSKDLGDFNVIEGVGSTKGPWFPVYPYEFENLYYLSCFYNNNSKPIISPVVEIADNSYDFDNAQSCTVQVGEISGQSKTCSMFPNPANGKSTIQFPTTITEGKVIVINKLGQTVMQYRIFNTDHFNLTTADLTTGVYHFLISDTKSGKTYTGKFSRD